MRVDDLSAVIGWFGSGEEDADAIGAFVVAQDIFGIAQPHAVPIATGRGAVVIVAAAGCAHVRAAHAHGLVECCDGHGSAADITLAAASRGRG